MDLSYAVLLTIPAQAALTAFTYRGIHAWTSRDIHPTGTWAATVGTANAAATAAALAITPLTGPFPAIATATLTYLGVLAISTDLASRKVPRDIPHLAALINLACFAASGHRSWPAVISLAVTTVALVVLPWIARAATRNGLGFSDIRLLWVFTTALAWWTGPNILIWALIAACLTQLALRPVSARLRLARTVPVLDADGTPTGRTRTELPFAPALVTAYLAAAGYAAATGATACAALATCPR